MHAFLRLPKWLLLDRKESKIFFFSCSHTHNTTRNTSLSDPGDPCGWDQESGRRGAHNQAAPSAKHRHILWNSLLFNTDC